MSTYKRADQETTDLANELLFEFADIPQGGYQDIIDNRVKIDILMAYADRDEQGVKTGDAITHGGYPALGLCSVRPLKLRAAGLGDVEILLDADFWDVCGPDKRRALLDHELFHIDFARDAKSGIIKRDDLERPMIKMRKHTYDFGWFAEIARRHGRFSVERQQAAIIVDQHGQVIFGDLLLAAVSSATAKK